MNYVQRKEKAIPGNQISAVFFIRLYNYV